MILLWGLIGIQLAYAQLGSFIPENKIYNKEPSKALNTQDINDPLRDGIYGAITTKDGNKKVSGILDAGKIQNTDNAQQQTLALVRNVINYALGLISLIALAYMIYHGYLIVTAGWDNKQYDKGLSWIKTAGMAIWGIGLSWFIVSFIFYVLNQVGWSTTNTEVSVQSAPVTVGWN